MIDSQEIRTNVILIRPLVASDYPKFSELNDDQGVSDFLSSIRKNRLAVEFEKQIDSVLKTGLGSRAVCSQESGDFLGIVGVLGDSKTPEIYGAILKRFRKNRFASNAIQAISESIFIRTVHQKVKAVVDIDNTGGRIVVEHAGFKESHIEYDELRKKETTVFYKRCSGNPSRSDCFEVIE